MSADLITTIESVERRPDGTHIVGVGLEEQTILPKSVQKFRARGRAMIATGLVELAGARVSDVAQAIKELEIGKIKRNTEVLGSTVNDEGMEVIRVRVN